MDATDHGSQTANVNGDGNTVIIVNGDMYGPCPPPRHNSEPAPALRRKRRRTRRWLGTYAGVLTFASTAALGILTIRPPDPGPKTFTAPAHIAAHPPLARSARNAVKLLTPARVALNSPVRQPVQWPEGTSAMCRDGKFSESRSRSGTCSRHRGVAYWRFDADHPHWRRG